MNHRKQTGYLELVIGPMFSGKTSHLVDIYKQCTFCNIPVVVINHVIDNRYHEELLSTHDQRMIPCLKASSLMSLWEKSEELHAAHTVLINEGQFFPDLFEAVEAMLAHKQNVYVGGLDGDFERKKFGRILDLVPLCDKVTKLTSLCSSCKDGTKAIFSKRLTSDKSQTLVGSSNYIPVCRACYEKDLDCDSVNEPSTPILSSASDVGTRSNVATPSVASKKLFPEEDNDSISTLSTAPPSPFTV